MSEKDLKKWFQTWVNHQSVPPIPEDHLIQFEKRLKKHHPNKNLSYFLRAAVLIMLFGLVRMAIYFQTPAPPEVIQFQKVETHFFQHIEIQLEELQQSASPIVKQMIQHSQTQVELMQNDYEKLRAKWEENPLQPQLINALIKNLKQQSELLEQIQNNISQLQYLNYETL